MALTNTNEIQGLIEDLINKEEIRAVDLKKKFEELSAQMNEKGLEIPNAGHEIVIGDDINVKCNTQKSKMIVFNTSQRTVEDFIGKVKIGYANECPQSKDIGLGIKDDSGRTILLRNNIDISYLSNWYFAQEVPFILASLLTKEDLEPLNFKFAKECLNKDAVAVFRVEAAGPEKCLVYLAIPVSYDEKEGRKYLESIFGEINALMFLDEAEDLITIDSKESWEYCIETGVGMSKNGRYPLLVVQRK